MELGETWGSLRGPLREKFTFSDIKEIVGAAGLPVHRLGHVRQGRDGATKGQLLDSVDLLFREKLPEDQDRVVVNCIREMVQRVRSDQREEFCELLTELLARVGWGLMENEPYPLSLQIGADTTTVDDETREAISKCLRRFRDGDLSGALTAICGAVDKLTERVFERDPTLGDHRKTPYAVRVRKAFLSYEGAFKEQFSSSALQASDTDMMWHQQLKSVEQAGEVLARLRQLSDAHGERAASALAIQRAMDCAVYIVRMFAGVA